MNVTVHYTTQLKAALGHSSEEIMLEANATLPDLVKQLVQKHGDPLRSLLLNEKNELLPSILFCVGDQQVTYERPESLAEGDHVTLLSAISGG